MANGVSGDFYTKFLGRNKKPYPETLSKEALLSLGELIQEPEIRSFYYLLAITGVRITEGLRILSTDITLEYSKKLRSEKHFVYIQTEKRKDGLNRQIPMWVIRDKTEQDMFNKILPTIETTKQGRLWDLNRSRVWEHFNKSITLDSVKNVIGREPREIFNGRTIPLTKFRFYPHFLRSCRCDILYPRYYDEKQTMKYFGWVSRRMIDIYSHASIDDYEPKGGDLEI